jgi:hypothetical protein
VTNSGSGYVAVPNVTIVGTGAGAQAEAVLSNGSVSGITVLDGGNGYVPTPTSVEPAYVEINMGFITEIVAR